MASQNSGPARQQRDDSPGVPWTALVQKSASSRLKSKTGRKITRTMMQTIERWSLVQAGDKIMVAVSGGKDSYTLLDLLWEAKGRAPFDFDIIGVHLDQVQPGYNGQPLLQWLLKSHLRLFKKTLIPSSSVAPRKGRPTASCVPVFVEEFSILLLSVLAATRLLWGTTATTLLRP